MTSTTKNPRPLKVCCEMCGKSIEVSDKGRIPQFHKACATVRDSMARLERDADALAKTMTDAEKAAFRKLLVGNFFHWTNATFNAAKVKGHRKAKA